MDVQPLRGVLRYFEAVPDPRRFNVTYTLPQLLSCVLMAVLCRYEENLWHYRLFCSYDMGGLSKLRGGRDTLASDLDYYFRQWARKRGKKKGQATL